MKVNIKLDSDIVEFDSTIISKEEFMKWIDDTFDEAIYKYFMVFNYLFLSWHIDQNMEGWNEECNKQLNAVDHLMRKLFYWKVEDLTEDELKNWNASLYKMFEATNPKITIW